MKEVRVEQSITVLESRSVKLYLQELKKIPVLSHEEEFDLISKIQEGNKKAEENLILFNLRFVITVAKKYSAQTNLPLEDLISEGNIGLIKAAQRFDKSRGFKFISYAVWWIQQSIIKFITEQGKTIRVPANKGLSRKEFEKYQNKFMQEWQSIPDIDAFHAAYGIDESQIRHQSCFHSSVESLDFSMNSSEDCEPVSAAIASDLFLDGNQNCIQKELPSLVNAVLQKLTEKERLIIQYLFGFKDCQSTRLEDVGTAMSLSRERVRQIKESALMKLKKYKYLQYAQA